MIQSPDGGRCILAVRRCIAGFLAVWPPTIFRCIAGFLAVWLRTISRYIAGFLAVWPRTIRWNHERVDFCYVTAKLLSATGQFNSSASSSRSQEVLGPGPVVPFNFNEICVAQRLIEYA